MVPGGFVGTGVGYINSSRAQEVIKKDIRITTNPFLGVDDFFNLLPPQDRHYTKGIKMILLSYTELRNPAYNKWGKLKLLIKKI
jgi:hypothetical protein